MPRRALLLTYPAIITLSTCALIHLSDLLGTHRNSLRSRWRKLTRAASLAWPVYRYLREATDLIPSARRPTRLPQRIRHRARCCCPTDDVRSVVATISGLTFTSASSNGTYTFSWSRQGRHV
jgi:hypothetical protein